MEAQITLGDIVADVILKDIKNVHLSVYPPNGHVRISAPERMTIDNVRAYAVTKLAWIKRQQQKLLAQDRLTTRLYVSGESHYLWGKRYLLRVVESHPRLVRVGAKHIELHVHHEDSRDDRQDLLESWLRQQIKAEIPGLIEKWKGKLGVEVMGFFVQRMKTKWGSCNTDRSTIRLNTELAKKPIECLEYVVLHEIVHLLERSHSPRFKALMSEHMPKWQFYRDELNSLPLTEEDWSR